MPANPERPIRFTNSERARVLDRLDAILERADQVRDELYVVARRAGTVPSGWTDKQIDHLCDAARQLANAVEKSPQNGE